MSFRGDRQEFEQLVLEELAPLFRLAYRLTGNRTSAEDLAQETLLRAYRSIDEFTLQDWGVRPWLFKILHNIFFNERAAEKRHHTLDVEPTWELIADQHPEPWPMTEDIDHIDWESFDEEIKRGVESLAPEYRMVLLLWSLEQLNYKEIARICEIPVGTVMSRLYRARKEMADKLADYAQTHRLLKNHNLTGPPDPERKTTTLIPKGT